jgi:hypothetical protein
MKRFKKGLAWFVVLVMLLGALPVFPAAVVSGQTVAVGELVSFGERQWRVLDRQGNSALLLQQTLTESRQYHDAEGNITWENSSLREWLNDDFLNDFSADDRARIRETNVINNNNQWYGTVGGGNTTDKIFLLSIEEVVQYFGDSGQLGNRPGTAAFISDGFNNARIARSSLTSNEATWLLRSPGHLPDRVSIVTGTGTLDMNGIHILQNRYLRPALWLNLGDTSTQISSAEARTLLEDAEIAVSDAISALCNAYGDLPFGTDLKTVEDAATNALGRFESPVLISEEFALRIVENRLIGTITFSISEDYISDSSTAITRTAVINFSIETDATTTPFTAAEAEALLEAAEIAVRDAITALYNDDDELQFGTTPITIINTATDALDKFESPVLITKEFALRIEENRLVGTITFSISEDYISDSDTAITHTAVINFSIEVKTEAAPTITSANNFSTVAGVLGTFQVTATGVPAPAFSLTDAPSGVTIDPATGTISIAGTTAVGSYTFAVVAANSVGNATQAFTLVVSSSPVPRQPVIVRATNDSEAFINLTTEVISVPITVAEYSVNGGSKWKRGALPTNPVKLFNRELTLSVRSERGGGTQIDFPKINARPRVNVEKLRPWYSAETWTLRATAAKENTVANPPAAPTNVYEWIQGDTTSGLIPTSPEWNLMSEGHGFNIVQAEKGVRIAYFFRSEPVGENGEYTPASRPFRVRPAAFRKSLNLRINYKIEVLKTKIGQEYSTDGGATWTPAPVNSDGKAILLDVSGFITEGDEILIRTATTGRRTRTVTQSINPQPRARLAEALPRELPVSNGRIDAEALRPYNVKIDDRWKSVPRFNAATAGVYDIRVSPTAVMSKGEWTGDAASITGTLTVTWGVVGKNSKGSDIMGVTRAVITEHGVTPPIVPPSGGGTTTESALQVTAFE